MPATEHAGRALLRALPLSALAALGAAPLFFIAAHGALSRPRIDASAFGHSVAFALTGALLACALGGAAGLMVGVLDFPWRRPLAALLAFPLAAPPAFWWLGIARAPGVSGHPFSGLAAGTIAAALALAPVPYLLTLAAVREVSSSTYDAARLALPPRTRVARVLLPLCRGAFAAGFLLCVVLLLGESEIPFLFGFSTLTTEVVTRFGQTFDASKVAPIALPLVVCALALGGAARRPLFGSLLTRRAGDGVRRTRRNVALLPALLLAWPAVWALVGYGAGAARGLLAGRPSPLSRSAVLASISEPVLCALIAIPISIAAASIARGSRLLQPLLGFGLLVFCVPSSVLAIGWIGLGAPGGVQVPPALVHVSRLWPLGALAFAAANARLPRSLEDAAALVPISPFSRMARIVLPVLAPSLAAGSVLTAMLVFADRDVSSLLLSPGSERALLDLYLVSANAPSAVVGLTALGALGCGLLAGAVAGLVPWLVLRPRG
jgi:iron(III) transport system permease protein